MAIEDKKYREEKVNYEPENMGTGRQLAFRGLNRHSLQRLYHATTHQHTDIDGLLYSIVGRQLVIGIW